jgi:phthiocerol/phenolphthiocerol synthesis type-I polyketide synthase D
MNRTEIQDWLVRRTAWKLRVAPETIDIDSPIDDFGLDSREIIALTGEIEQVLHVQVEATVLWEYPTLAELTTHLFALTQAAGAAGDPQKSSG